MTAITKPNFDGSVSVGPLAISTTLISVLNVPTMGKNGSVLFSFSLDSGSRTLSSVALKQAAIPGGTHVTVLLDADFNTANSKIPMVVTQQNPVDILSVAGLVEVQIEVDIGGAAEISLWLKASGSCNVNATANVTNPRVAT